MSKKIQTALCFCLSGFMGFVCAEESASAAAPPPAGLVCEEPVYDYGTVSASSVEHTFIIKNTADHFVNIVKVRKTCGCVSAVPAKKKLAPGETIELNVKISLANRVGRQRKPVYVISDCKANPMLRLMIKGLVSRKAVRTN